MTFELLVTWEDEDSEELRQRGFFIKSDDMETAVKQAKAFCDGIEVCPAYTHARVRYISAVEEE